MAMLNMGVIRAMFVVKRRSHSPHSPRGRHSGKMHEVTDNGGTVKPIKDLNYHVKMVSHECVSSGWKF